MKLQPLALVVANPPEHVVAGIRRLQARITGETGERVTQSAACLAAIRAGLKQLRCMEKKQ